MNCQKKKMKIKTHTHKIIGPTIVSSLVILTISKGGLLMEHILYMLNTSVPIPIK